MVQNEAQVLTFTIPIFEPMPSQFLVRAVSDRWLGSEVVTAMSFQHLILPERLPPHTGKTLLIFMSLSVSLTVKKRIIAMIFQ